MSEFTDAHPLVTCEQNNSVLFKEVGFFLRCFIRMITVGNHVESVLNTHLLCVCLPRRESTGSDECCFLSPADHS